MNHSHLLRMLITGESFREDVLILSSSGTAAVCNLGFMAELDTSGHCLLPGRLQVTDSKPLQVSSLFSSLSSVQWQCCPQFYILSSRKQLRF